MKINKQLALLFVVVLMVIIIVFAQYVQKNRIGTEELISATAPSGVKVTNTAVDYTIVPTEETKDPKGLALLDRVTPQTSSNNKIQLEKLTSALKENTNNYNQWIELGVYRKEAKDFEGAVLAWEYASAVSPNNKVAYINMGNIYHYYLKDYPKAEINFKKAIEREPAYVDSYVRLFNLYSQSYQQNTTKAADILKLGIARNPKAVDLYTSLASYYKEKGDKVSALNYYKQALAIAEQLKNDTLISAIKAEISALSLLSP